MTMTADHNALRIISVGLPPEQHADRIIALMLRQISQDTAGLIPAAVTTAARSSDGGPKAQFKLAKRIQRAGGLDVGLAPGKRGRYVIRFRTWSGWDPAADMFIESGAVVPAKPWLASLMHEIVSDGGGAERVNLLVHVPLILTHHSLSRLAQRHGVRTVADLVAACEGIREAVASFEETIKNEKQPAEGWRTNSTNGAVIVLKRHEAVGALIAATIL